MLDTDDLPDWLLLRTQISNRSSRQYLVLQEEQCQCAYLSRQWLTHCQTGHAGWCFRECSAVLLIMNLLSSVKRTAFLGWTESSGVLWWKPVKLHGGAGLWSRVPLMDVKTSWHSHRVCFPTIWSETWVACWRSFCAPPFLHHTNEYISVLLPGWCPSAALSSYSSVLAHLLISSTLLRVCSETQQTFLCHDRGAARPVLPECAAKTISSNQQQKQRHSSELWPNIIKMFGQK